MTSVLAIFSLSLWERVGERAYVAPPGCSPLPCRSLRERRAILVALDNQLRLVTIEVCDVIAKLMLSSKFELQQLTISQKLPQQALSGRLLLSQFARKLHQSSDLIGHLDIVFEQSLSRLSEDNGEGVMLSRLIPLPSPLPKGEGVSSTQA